MASILISGTSSGIGRELVVQLVRKNHVVWGIARNEEKLKQLAVDLQSPDFYYCNCDVRKPDDIQNLNRQMESKGFRPDILILNAGVISSSSEINHDTNYSGIVNIWKCFEKDMQMSRGIVAVSGSLFALVPAPFNLSYSKSKSDALNFIKEISAEKENDGIRFTYFVLGPIHTDIHKPLPLWKSFFIPSTQNAAQYMINHLGNEGLINIFPFSSKVMVLLNSVLPKIIMNRLITFLKR